jgi:hypothetical protein
MAKGKVSGDVLLQVGMDLSSTISNISDGNKRFELNKQAQYLSLEERNNLERELQRTSSLESRIKLVTDAMQKIKDSQQRAITLSKREAEIILKKSREKNRNIIILGGSLAILFAIYLYKKMK